MATGWLECPISLRRRDRCGPRRLRWSYPFAGTVSIDIPSGTRKRIRLTWRAGSIRDIEIEDDSDSAGVMDGARPRKII